MEEIAAIHCIETDTQWFGRGIKGSTHVLFGYFYTIHIDSVFGTIVNECQVFPCTHCEFVTGTCIHI